MDEGSFDRFTDHRPSRRVVSGALFSAMLTGLINVKPGIVKGVGLMQSDSDCNLGCENSTCGAVPVDCPLFPPDNIWNTPIASLPVAEQSDAFVASIGPDVGLHPDFGSGLYEGSPLGIPFVRVPKGQPTVEITFEVAEESDPGPYPIPADAPVEGGACGTGDRHVVVVQEDTCLLYELYNATRQPDGSWQALS
ncbi:MAG: hypothetical protein ACR2OU_13525, partial [Thermomicrobiales bacterium]